MERVANPGEGKRQREDRKLDIKVMFCVCVGCWYMICCRLWDIEVDGSRGKRLRLRCSTDYSGGSRRRCCEKDFSPSSQQRKITAKVERTTTGIIRTTHLVRRAIDQTRRRRLHVPISVSIPQGLMKEPKRTSLTTAVPGVRYSG